MEVQRPGGEDAEMEKKNPNGNSDAITRAYLDSLLLEMRLMGSELPSTKFELYGENFTTPVMTAALSHLDNVRPGGMTELARGAAAAGAVLWAGMGEAPEMASMAATGAKVIKIVKPYADNEIVLDQLRHAESCGALAVGMDIDHAFNRNGGYDEVAGHAMRPKSMDEMRRFVVATRLPFVVKGVLSARDAIRCLEVGARGIVVSHHHGIMDFAVPPLQILPEILEAVGGRIPVFVDCSIETGMDAYKAFALGATAVSVGRALMRPLKDNGAEGVRAALEEITGALSFAMAMTGVADLAHMDSSVLRKKTVG